MPTPRRPSYNNASAPGRHAGYSLVEFSVIAVPVLMAGLGCIEVAQWFFVKQAVSLALLEAGRAGITHHAQPQAIEAAFEHALAALYPATDKPASRQRLHDALQQRRLKTGGPPWRIEILQPGAAAFTDFGSLDLAVSTHHGLAAINNSYQAEQHRRHIADGWTHGRGPASGLSVYEANTLVLRLTYLHEPILPGLKGLIRQLAPDARGYGAHAMSTSGYLPLQQEIRLTMQSHPLQWPALPSGKVVAARTASYDAAPASVAPACAGVWCFRKNGREAGFPTTTNGHAGTAVAIDLSPGASPDISLPAWPTHGSPGTGGLPRIDNPDCGVTLCCLPG